MVHTVFSSLSYYLEMIVLRRKEFRSIPTELKGSRALTTLRCFTKLRMTCNQKTSGVFGNRSSKYRLHEENSVDQSIITLNISESCNSWKHNTGKGKMLNYRYQNISPLKKLLSNIPGNLLVSNCAQNSGLKKTQKTQKAKTQQNQK